MKDFYQMVLGPSWSYDLGYFCCICFLYFSQEQFMLDEQEGISLKYSYLIETGQKLWDAAKTATQGCPVVLTSNQNVLCIMVGCQNRKTRTNH